MVTADELVRKINTGDLKPEEIYVGGKIGEDVSLKGIAGINIQPGVKKAIDAFKSEVKKQLNL
jgi:hypothetical protein